MAEEQAEETALGDGPIEDEYRQRMNFLAAQLDEFFNGSAKGKDRKTGFCLMVFGFGDSGRCNYISNADRADVINLLKSQIARFEGAPEPPGT